MQKIAKTLALAMIGVPAVQVAQATNVLLIVADDQSYPHAGAYGCPWVSTPGFDRIAREGVLFSNFYTPNAKSAPSRACLLTGRYSWQLGPLANHIPVWPQGEYVTIFEALARSGVSAGFTGKGWAPGKALDAKGKTRRLTGKPYQKHLVQNPPTTELGKWDYTENFREFLEDNSREGSQWIFWMGIREPHRKYEPGSGVRVGGHALQDVDHVPAYWPDTDTVRSDMLDYAYEIEYYDSHIVRVLKLLDEAGVADDTIVIITSDNGMPFPRSKGNSYEGSVHLPLAVRWPAGVVNPGRKCDAYVSMTDLAPSIMEAMGADPSSLGMQPFAGKSIIPLLRAHRETVHEYLLFGRERHDEARPGNTGYPLRAVLGDGMLYIRNIYPERWPAGNPEYGYRDADSSPTKSSILEAYRRGEMAREWELCFGLRSAEELYDLSQDPDCMNNLAGEARYKAPKKRLEKMLMRGLRRTSDPRVTGKSEDFDSYAFYKDYLWNGYEKYMAGGPITDKVFLGSDYEPTPLKTGK